MEDLKDLEDLEDVKNLKNSVEFWSSVEALQVLLDSGILEFC